MINLALDIENNVFVFQLPDKEETPQDIQVQN